MRRSFFIDTAILSDIQTSWDIVKHGTNVHSMFDGITTNPNAINKAGIATYSGLQQHILRLANWIAENATGENIKIIYVQYPDSKANRYEISKFTEDLTDINRYVFRQISPHIRIGLKIHPNFVKEVMTYGGISLNVTGIASAYQGIECCREAISHVSIIPGRMEEAGLDASAHMRLLVSNRGKSEIISGSMRTLDGLKRAIDCETVPTIGPKVFQLLSGHAQFTELFAPSVQETAKCSELGEAFFKQMDDAGVSLLGDLKGRYGCN